MRVPAISRSKHLRLICCLPPSSFWENNMRSFSFLIPAFALFAVAHCLGQAPTQTTAPLRVGIVGLVHGHVQGFLDHSLHSSLIEIVGIAEPDEKLASQYATHYGFD